ncbi:MAG TPA: DUF2784 domain-containing protein [Pseudodesulfovibrio sp.]|nr:DUF2784 domain-containing protein [Pseudodesulfovibrio sp.]
MTDGAPALWADVLLTVHFGIAAFLTLGLPLIWVGAVVGWRFVRNPWFRWSHAGLMFFVLAETLAGKLCPLTVWEATLRHAAGEDGGDAVSFVAYWLGRLLFPDVAPAWFRVAYCLFFVLIVLTLFLIPVRGAAKPAEPHDEQKHN